MNGGYLSTDIVNTEYGLVAQILVYNTLKVNGDVSPVYRINIIFADSAPETLDPMDQPEVNVTVEAYGITFSTTNKTLIWDENNHYFYAFLPGSVQMPTNNYITINSCIITNLDGSATNLTLKGVLDGEFGYSETITFDSSTSLYMYNFANSVVENSCAGYIDVCNAKGDMLYQIAIAFDYSNYMPQGGDIAITVLYGDTELYLYKNYTGTILTYDDGDTKYFYAYLGTDAYTDGKTKLTLDAIFVMGPESVVDAFNTSNVITLTDYEAASVTLTIGRHNSMNCVAFEIMEGVILYLYLADKAE